MSPAAATTGSAALEAGFAEKAAIRATRRRPRPRQDQEFMRGLLGAPRPGALIALEETDQLSVRARAVPNDESSDGATGPSPSVANYTEWSRIDRT
jgi:hypothetical protein